jgi:hypothetical protein
VVLERIGTEPVSAREIFVVELAGPQWLVAPLRASSPRFVCLLAWDAQDVPTSAIADVARQLLDSGAVWISCWGPDCERVHDTVDDVFRTWARQSKGVVMTTWHADEQLAEVISFSLLGFFPDDEYAEGCRSLLGISIGQSAWAAEMRNAYRDPAGYLARALDADDHDNAV